jgi:sugar lactone lactonase YvrE
MRWAGETQLAESPVWDAKEQCLYAVDAVQGCVLQLDPKRCDVLRIGVGELVGSVALTRSDGLIVAAASGVSELGNGRRILAALRAPSTHLNDGKCDPVGRFWFGTVVDKGRTRRGQLLQLDPKGGLTTMLDGVGFPNGLDWSLDWSLFYFVDSADRSVDAFSFRPRTGQLGDRRRWWSVPAGMGIPDGLTVDAEAHIWVAIWGSSSVVRLTPDGVVDRKIVLPVAEVTSCAFGGADLRDLYVTTASGIFRCRPGPAGRPPQRFGA